MNLQSSPKLPNGANEQTFIPTKYFINSNDPNFSLLCFFVSLFHQLLGRRCEGVETIWILTTLFKYWCLSFCRNEIDPIFYSWQSRLRLPPGWCFIFRLVLWHFCWCCGQFCEPPGWIFLLLLYLHYPDPPAV